MKYAALTQLVHAAVSFAESDVLSHFQRRTRIATNRRSLVKAARAYLRSTGVPKQSAKEIDDLLTDCGFERGEFNRELKLEDADGQV